MPKKDVSEKTKKVATKKSVKLEITMVGTVEVDVTEEQLEALRDDVPCGKDDLPKEILAQLDMTKIASELDCEVTDVIEDE